MINPNALKNLAILALVISGIIYENSAHAPPAPLGSLTQEPFFTK